MQVKLNVTEKQEILLEKLKNEKGYNSIEDAAQGFIDNNLVEIVDVVKPASDITEIVSNSKQDVTMQIKKNKLIATLGNEMERLKKKNPEENYKKVERLVWELCQL